MVDEKTGERFSFVPKHDLFWIPMQYWSVFIFGCGVVLVFLKLLSMGGWTE
jgi:hypothetical protein